MSAGWTIELRVGHRMTVRDGGRFRPTLDALLTDDLVTPDAESGHTPAHRAGRITG